jgi:general secretion pathway protein A
MYAASFGLKEPPFSITPDPRYLYLGESHREALAHLLYGTGEGGGFVQLTGEVGTGKTTLCRSLIEQLPPEVDVALVFNPVLTPAELVATVCDELGVAYPAGASLKGLVDVLHRHLLGAHARGRRTVLIVDEAQGLGFEVLEQIRLLTNLETETTKLLQVILIGQPELPGRLDQPRLRQLAQRITARCDLRPLSEPETGEYVRHRMEVAGWSEASGDGGELFGPAALREIHRLSGGVPRLINVICDRALLGTYALDRDRVDAATVRRAAREVLGPRGEATRRRAPVGIAAAAGVVTVAAVLVALWALRPPGWPGGLSTGSADRAAAPVVTPVAGPVHAVGAEAPTASAGKAAPVGGAEQAGPAAGVEKAAAVSAAALPAGAAKGASQAGAAKGVPPAGARTVAPPAALGLAEVLADRSLATDRTSAFASLLAQWEPERPAPPPDALECREGRLGRYRCLIRTGTWTRLRRYNLPAVLELVAPNGDRHYAALTMLGRENATLHIGGRAYSLPLDEVDPFWDGGFTLLWEAPSLGRAVIVPGMRGPETEWLRRRIAALDGTPVDGGAARDVYDDALKARVTAFQKSRGLRPDGIVGEETLAQLTLAVPERGTPLLSGRRAE